MSLLDDVSIVVTPNGYKAGELYAIKPTFALGSELVTNSIFNSDNTSDWENGFYDLFTFVSSEGGFYNLQRVTANARTNINLSSVLTVGKRYKVTVVARGSGNIKTGLTTSGYTTQPSAVFTLTSSFASYSTIVTVTSGLVYGVLWNDDGNSDIDYQSYSVKEYTSADMDVTRATAATRVDEDGLVNYAEIIGSELVNCSSFDCADPAAVWNEGTGWSFSGGKAIYDGTGGTSPLAQSDVIEVGKQYKITVEVLSNEGSGSNTIYLGGTILSVGNLSVGTHTFFGATNNTSVILTIYGRSGEVFEIGSLSIKEVTRDNVPRIDYTGGGCPHILAEPQRTNLVTYSEDFSDSSWTSGNISVAISTVLSPDGTTYSYKLTNDAVSGNHFLRDVVTVTSGVPYTLSVFIKKGTRDIVSIGDGYNQNILANFDLTNGTVTNVSATSSSIESYNNGWFKCIATITPSTTNLGLMIFSGIVYAGKDESGDFYVWGGQAEQGSYATSYIPTSGSTVTRNQDIFTRDGIGSLINSEEGVLFVEMAALADDGTDRRITLTDGTTGNAVNIGLSRFTSNINAEIHSGGSLQTSGWGGTGVTQTNNNKFALSWGSGTMKFYINGSPTSSQTGVTSPIGLNNLKFSSGDDTLNFFGKVKQLQVYNTALTDEQLLQLTGESGTDFYESYAEMASALTYTIQ